MSDNYDLLVVGNGFDLALGYKTRYSDFHSALKIAAESKDVNAFLDEFLGSDHDSDKYKNGCARGAKLFYSKVQEMKENNLFVSYFLDCSDEYEWNRIETEIERIVTVFDLVLDQLGKYQRGPHCYNVDATSVLLDSDIFVHIKQYSLLRFDAVLNVNKGIAIVRVTLLNEKNENEITLIRKLKESIPKSLCSDLELFQNLFTLYLNIVLGFQELKHPYHPNVHAIVNYNYTPIAQNAIGSVSSDDVLYLHGRFTEQEQVSDSFKNEPVIFGPGKKDYLVKGFMSLSKLNQALVYQTDFSFLNQFLSEFGEGKRFDTRIAFFGHSLDVCDKDSILRILAVNNWKNTIDIYAYDQQAKRDIVNNLRIILGDKLDSLNADGKINFYDAKSFFGGDK